MKILGEFTMAQPAYRTASRLVERDNGKIGLQYQHAGEPGVWCDEQWLPFHNDNMDAVLRAAATLIKPTTKKKKQP